MSKNKRLGVSIFLVVLTILMALSVIFTFSISYMFSKSGVSGKVFGKYIYIMETADMKPEIEKGSAVIADKDGTAVLTPGNVILFKNGEREDVMRIRDVVHNASGTDENSAFSTVYHVSSDKTPDETLEINKDKVIAKCETEGRTLGKVISFFSSMMGILVGMILPCLVILMVLIVKIISLKKMDMQEDTQPYYEEDEEDNSEFEGFNGQQMRKRNSSPLFNPESGINPSDDFENKKSSIAENFKMKPGAVPQRPQRQRVEDAPKAAVEKFKAAVEEKPNVSVTRKPSLIPESTSLEDSDNLNSIKNTLNQNESSFNDEPLIPKSRNILERTAAFSAIKNYPTTPPPAPKKPSEPPVRKAPAVKNDNINSIDDLIKALENEKKKL